MGFSGSSDGEESTCSAGDEGSVSGSGRSPGGGHSNPVQCSCLETPWTEEPGGLRSAGSQADTAERSMANHILFIQSCAGGHVGGFHLWQLWIMPQ